VDNFQGAPSLARVDRSRDNTRVERGWGGGTPLIHWRIPALARASYHYTNMEYTPLEGIKAAGPALPEALGFLLISRLLLNLKG